MSETALIVGAGSGLSASLARLFNDQGMQIALAARNIEKLDPLIQETSAKAYACDVSRPGDVRKLFDQIIADTKSLDVVVYNPSFRTPGAITEIDPDSVHKALMITCYGGFLVAQAAAKIMIGQKSGTLLFTGASASSKGYANSASFAMGKFGLRGLAQSMARELAPQNIHVAHFVIDGGIASKGSKDKQPINDNLLDPDAIAQNYLHLHRQHRSAWTWEIELRPWTEKF